MNNIAQFAELFKDERQLREKLAQLLRAIPGNHGVRVTHGSLELGKDIIFYRADPLSGASCHACVVKNDRISGDIASNGGARTVLLQAQQALDSARTADDGTQEFMRSVYVVSPYECSEATINSIKGPLNERKGSIEFICGSRLLDLFQKYDPASLVFDSAYLSNYVMNLRSTLARTDPVSFLMDQIDVISGGLKQFESVYVKQDFTKRFWLFELGEHAELPLVRPNKTDNLAVGLIIRWLRRVAPFASDEQIWRDTNDRPSDCKEDDILAFATKLRRRWDEDWAKRASRLAASHASLDEKRTIPFPKDLLAGYNSITQSVAKALGDLSEVVARSNAYVRGLRDHADLGTTDYLSYCRIEDIARRHPSFVKTEGLATTIMISRDVIENTSVPTLITAPAGHGKTSFCKWRVLEAIRALEEHRSQAIPFYIALHHYAAQDLAGKGEEAFFTDPALLRTFEDLCRGNSRIRVFFDGLDEVTTSERRSALMREAERMHIRHPTVDIVVTARNHVGGVALRWLSRVELSELSEAHVEELASKWLGQQTPDLQAFFTQLERSRTLEPLTRVPLLCTLIIAVFRRNRSLPSTRSRLYEIVIDLMCGGWDLAKNVRRRLRFGSDQKRSVLTRFAGILHTNRRREGTEREFELAVGDVSPSTSPYWRDFLSEILEDSLICSIGGNLAFSHLSFQEFLAAKDLNDPAGARQKTALKAYLSGDDWWAEVLSFFIASSSRQIEMSNWVENEAQKATYLIKDRNARIAYLFEASLDVSGAGEFPSK